MSKPASASASGQFAIGDDLTVNRLGYGAMRITGEGIWGPPADREGAVATLKRLPDLGVNFIDTADSYGPYISEDLIKAALHPYDPLDAKPRKAREYALPQIFWTAKRCPSDLWQLHRIDPKVPRDEQFDVVAAMQKEGLIKHAGLSEVGIDDIQAARKHFKVATVQNQYTLVDRKSEEVLDFCEKEGIGFIPWFPLAAGELAKPGSLLSMIAKEHEVTTGAVALAWLLKRSRVMLPIPGTGSVDHLVENVAGASVELTDEQFQELDRQGRAAK